MRIYRGVSVSLDLLNGGKLVSSGTDDELEAQCGDLHVQFGTTVIEFGRSASNARYLHNACSSANRTSYLSFTSDENVARWFATYENSEPGWIYEVDTEHLSAGGIEFFEGTDEAVNPGESEILVNIHGMTELAAGFVIRKYRVEPTA